MCTDLKRMRENRCTFRQDFEHTDFYLLRYSTRCPAMRRWFVLTSVTGYPTFKRRSNCDKGGKSGAVKIEISSQEGLIFFVFIQEGTDVSPAVSLGSKIKAHNQQHLERAPPPLERKHLSRFEFDQIMSVPWFARGIIWAGPFLSPPTETRRIRNIAVLAKLATYFAAFLRYCTLEGRLALLFFRFPRRNLFVFLVFP